MSNSKGTCYSETAPNFTLSWLQKYLYLKNGIKRALHDNGKKSFWNILKKICPEMKTHFLQISLIYYR